MMIQNSSFGTGREIALRWMPKNLTNEKSALVQVLSNGLTPSSGNKPLPEPVMTKFFGTLWHYYYSLGHNELNLFHLSIQIWVSVNNYIDNL